jgi:hypothetical protein
VAGALADCYGFCVLLPWVTLVELCVVGGLVLVGLSCCVFRPWACAVLLVLEGVWRVFALVLCAGSCLVVGLCFRLACVVSSAGRLSW